MAAMEAGSPPEMFFASHELLSEEERHQRLSRTLSYATLEHTLLKFRRFPASRMAHYMKTRLGTMRSLLRNRVGDVVVEDAFGDPAVSNISEGVKRGVLLAHMYIWGFVPVKVDYFRSNRTGIGAPLAGGRDVSPHRESLYLATAWADEVAFLKELRGRARSAAAKSRHARQIFPHSFCRTGWFKVPMLSDCTDFLWRTLRAGWLQGPISPDQHLPDLLPRRSCKLLSTAVGVATKLLVSSSCLADDAQFHAACALSEMVSMQDLDMAAAHWEVVALLLLLCDGCRLDGRGFTAGALDQVLWTFGSLVIEATRLKRVRPHEEPLAYLQAARAAAQAVPISAWRSRREPHSFGRPPCQRVLRGPLCVHDGQLLTADPAASDPFERNLPTCHYERQKLRSTALRLQPMPGQVGRLPSCTAAPRDTILLALPVYLRNTWHLTTALIFFQGALAWFHGPSGRKVLASLWHSAGLGSPPGGLQRNATEVLLVPSPRPGRVTELQRMVFVSLFGLLSDAPIRSLQPPGPCRCYQRAGLWGILEAPFSGPGDLIYPDVSAMRRAVAGEVHRLLPVSPPDPWRQRRPVGAVPALLVSRCGRGGKADCQKRNVTNLPTLSSALRRQGHGLLSVATLRMEDYPLLVQLQLILFRTRVLIAAFGATLAWTAFLQRGSFVIELHPGPPDRLVHWGSCWRQPPAMFELLDPPVPIWDLNPRSEWGGWAQAAHVHHACVAKPQAHGSRCLRLHVVDDWEVPEFETDVETVVALSLDAARRLSSHAAAKQR
ncbi:unnamed protein product [Symbiodinium natans]|uniref:Uncharacterized protein n=1 Tax=Symbiodinium natans TaxID=878477 RepID=A0A812SI00_9DINO|nr:unnamed protein product [Symbiodinium natans]